MNKIKTNKSVQKRVRITKTGKVLVFPTNHRHRLSSKNQRKKQTLRKKKYLPSAWRHRYNRDM